MSTHIPGYYEQAYQVFMVPQLLNLFLITCMAIGAAVMSYARQSPRSVHELPTWLIMIAGIGMLYALYIPVGFTVFTLLVILTHSLGGEIQALGTLIWGVTVWCGFMHSFSSGNTERM